MVTTKKATWVSPIVSCATNSITAELVKKIRWKWNCKQIFLRMEFHKNFILTQINLRTYKRRIVRHFHLWKFWRLSMVALDFFLRFLCTFLHWFTAILACCGWFSGWFGLFNGFIIHLWILHCKLPMIYRTVELHLFRKKHLFLNNFYGSSRTVVILVSLTYSPVEIQGSAYCSFP